jgi:hypothetical protein
MTPLLIGALLAVAAMVWVIAPIFAEERDDRALPPSSSPEADAAAEAEIRRWRGSKE